MANRKPTALTANTALINKLLENPQFPAYVQTLEPQILNKLVQRVGKEDAQALLTHATNAQIQDLIETDTWRCNKPGNEETFDPAKFLEWLELWIDIGASFLTAKLQGLGSELIALTLQCYVVVVDLEEVGVSGAVDTFHNFGVMPKSDDESWSLILRLLIEVWDSDAAFLEECLARCCQRRSLVVEKTHIADNESLQFDVAGTRDRHRREKGYVTSMSAAAFLAQARDSAIDSLLIEVAYDPFTSVHLRQLAKRSAAFTQPLVSATQSGATIVASNADDSAEQSWHKLEILMRELQAENSLPTEPLLLGVNTESEHYLKRQLQALGALNPHALTERQNEIIYIANILMEGASIAGRRMSELEAGLCANATANLGLMYCVFEEAWDDEEIVLRTLLQEAPGLIKAFKIGYHLLCQLPQQVLAALRRELSTPKSQRSLRSQPWIQQQVTNSLNGVNQANLSSTDRIDSVNELLEALDLIGDNTICQQFRILNAVLPQYPKSLEADATSGIHVNTQSRFIETPADLNRLHEFLNSLEGKLF